MAVYLPAYCTREEVKSAADILQTADYNAHIDSAIVAAVDDIDGLCHRRFWNAIETRSWDWPNYQYALPWRIWFDEAELADVTATVPVVMTGDQGSQTTISNSDIFWGNPRYAPPYTYMELNRSSTAVFGVGSTPQRDVSIQGLYGYWNKQRPAGTITAAVSSTTASTITVSNSAVLGVGDTIYIDTEAFLVSDKAFTDTSQSQQGSGCSTASNNDNILAVTTGSDYYVGEYLQLDAEIMLVTAVTGNNLTVVRAYDGSVLATHSGAEIYAGRLLTVLRGQFGTTAATHSNNAPISALMYPPEVHELAIAESLNYVAQKTSGYARVLAEGSSAVPGSSIPDLRARCLQRRGRKARQRVI